MPNGDLFDVLNSERATIVTENIEGFTQEKIALASGNTLDADVAVSATELNIHALGNIELHVDCKIIWVSDHMLYKDLTLSDLSNMVIMLGYINALWTLKVDMASEYLCHLINYMKQKNCREVLPITDLNEKLDDAVMRRLNSG